MSTRIGKWETLGNALFPLYPGSGRIDSQSPPPVRSNHLPSLVIFTRPKSTPKAMLRLSRAEDDSMASGGRGWGGWIELAGGWSEGGNDVDIHTRTTNMDTAHSSSRSHHLPTRDRCRHIPPPSVSPIHIDTILPSPHRNLSLTFSTANPYSLIRSAYPI